MESSIHDSCQLGANLKLFRLLSLLSQDQLAAALHMSRTNYVYLESGTRDTKPEDALLIERITSLRMDTLIHMDIRGQLLRYLHELDESTDDTSFANIYTRLSQMGRENVNLYLDRLLNQEV